jgi:hypothetical protein
MPPQVEEMTREELQSAVLDLYYKIENLQSENGNLKKLIFGAKSERFIAETDPKQTSLDFGQPEEKKAEPATETITYERERNTCRANCSSISL